MSSKTRMAQVGFCLFLGCYLASNTAFSSPTQPSASIGGESFATSWILVQMKTPLENADRDGAFSLTTGFPSVDRLILEKGIHRIESALSVSAWTARFPRALKRHGLDRWYRFHVPEGTDVLSLVEEFSALPEVDLAQPDYVVRVAGSVFPNDPEFPLQWGLNQLTDRDVDAPEAWSVATGDDVVIAVVDTGFDVHHPELEGKTVAARDVVDGEEDVYPEGGSPHGTMVASVVSANTNNGVGIAGTCWGCVIMPVKVFDAEGSSTASWLADGIVWAVDHNARVINLSMGGTNPIAVGIAAVGYAYDAGAVVVASSGNDNHDFVHYPSRNVETLGIGATQSDDTRWTWPNGEGSCYGERLDAVAPGADIRVATLGDDYTDVWGTSFAAPLTAGLVGIMRTMNPSLGRDEAKHLVRVGGEDQVGDPLEDTPGFDVYYGWGRVNMERSLLATRASTTLRLDGGATTRVFYDTANPLALSYDFIRGDLEAITEDHLGVDLGEVVCLEDDSLDPDTLGNEDLAIPPSGRAFFYLGRFNAVPGAGSYGASSRFRDRLPTRPMTVAAWGVGSDEERARLGRSVSAAGDVNGDGHDDVIVGAPMYDLGAADGGAAFVYHGSDSGLSGTPAWSMGTSQADAMYGYSVATAGDVNGDGFDDVIVGAYAHDGGLLNTGRAYVYLGSESGLAVTPQWEHDGTVGGEQFGWRVRSAGDVNDDQFDDVIVASRFFTNGQYQEGAAFLFLGSAAGLESDPAWSFETGQANAEVTGVGAAGDVNNDGYDDVVVGAQRFDGGHTDEGRVWVFHGSSLGLGLNPSTTLEVDSTNARLGWTVSTAGDVNDDGFDDVIAGAHRFSNGYTDEGAAFVFLGSKEGVLDAPDWSFECDQHNGRCGRTAEFAGDVNNDGYDDILVGAPYQDGVRTTAGQVWVFFGSPDGLSNTPDWSDGPKQAAAEFGWSAGTAGDVNDDNYDDLIGGAYLFDSGEIDEGKAFVYLGPDLGAPSTGTSGCAP